MRALLAAAAACLTALTLASPASADLPVLAGTTTIEGSRTGFTTVRLSQPVTIPLEGEAPAMRVSLTGSGRLYGFILRRDDDAKQWQDGVYVSLTHGDGAGHEPSPQTYPQYATQADWDRGFYTIPAGVYRLYVIADGKPVRAELRLPGLSGTASFTADTPVPQTLMALPRINGTAPGVYTFAGAATLRSQGTVILRPRVSSSQHVYSQEDLCMYGPQDTFDPATDFGTACGNPYSAAYGVQRDASPYAFSVPPRRYEWGREWAVPYRQPGPWTIGGTIRAIESGGVVEMTGAWIDWEPAKAAQPPKHPATPEPPQTAAQSQPAPVASPAPAPALAPSAAAPLPHATPAAAKRPSTARPKKPAAKKPCATKKRAGRKAALRTCAKKKKPAAKRRATRR